MNKSFSLEMDSEQVSMELYTSKNGKQIHLFVEVCYSDECPNFDFTGDLTDAEAERITPEAAAALFGRIAGFAAADIAAEASYEKQVAERIAAGEDPDDISVYPTQVYQKLSELFEVFCYGEAG